MADQQQNLISHFFLEVEGMAESAGVELMQSLLSVVVESSLHLPDVATIRVTDTALKWIDDKALEPGKRIKVSAEGPQSKGAHPLFDGDIVELEPEFLVGSHNLTIRAFDALHRLSRGRRVRSFLNMTDGDVIQKIASDAGMTASAEQANIVHPYLFQNNETDLEFLRARANAAGSVLFADGRKIRLEPPKADGEAIEMQWGENLQEFRPRMTTVNQVSSVTVRGWDPKTRQEIVGQAKHGNGVPQVGESRKPGDVVHAAFNREVPTLSASRPVHTQAEADQMARALAGSHSSRFIEAEGVCIGNAKVLAGTSVRLKALGDRFSGTYLVTSCRHTYSPTDGYQSQFMVSGQEPTSLLQTLAASASPSAPSRGLVIGIVTDNQDPDKQGRVKVKYPWLSPDHASDWARVVSVGGGPTRGIQFVPEINDEVLVGFEQGDVHHPYVLGGLWNGVDAPPGDQGKIVSGGKVQQRVIQSRTGHTITLDDADGAGGITVQDRAGNSIMLDSGANALKITIKGNASLECDGNLSLKAQGQVEIQGMGVKIDGGAGMVDVKGSLINLN
ncbi:MAG: VgrG-related protein [Gemmatimonadaceae bacterium]